MKRCIHMNTILWISVVIIILSGVTFAAGKVTITHLTYLGHGEAWTKFVNQRAQEFMKKYPDITVRVQPESNPATKFTVMAAAGIAPDVTDMHSIMAFPFVADGYFLDLRPFMERDGIKVEQYVPATLKAYTGKDGSIYCLPMEAAADVTYYNEDMIDEAGLFTPTRLGEKWTWDALVSMGLKLTRDTNGDGQIDIYGIDRATSMFGRGSILQQAGAKLYDRWLNPSKSLYNTPEVEKALEFIADLIVKYRISPSPGMEKTYYIWTGKSAISTVDGPGIISAYLTDVPFRWDIAMQPAGPSGSGSWVPTNGWQISRTTKHPEAAWLWIKYLASEESVREWVRLTGRTPALIAAQAHYVEFNKKAPRSWKVFFAAAIHPNSFPGYFLSKAQQINTIVAPILNRVYKGELSAKVALEQIHRGVSAILAEK